MDNSDDEALFDAIPICDTSKRPNVDLTKNNECRKKNIVEEKHLNISTVKAISVKLVRVPNKHDSVLSESKRKSKFKSIHERKQKQPKMEEFQQPQKWQIVKKLDDITENSKSPRDNPDKQSMKIRNNLSLDVEVNRQSNETATSKTSIYQGRLPYSLQRKQKVLSNETDKKVSSLVLELDNENTKQDLCSNKANTSNHEHISPQVTTILMERKDKDEYNNRNLFVESSMCRNPERMISTHKKSSKWQYKRKNFTCESLDEHITIKKRKKHRRMKLWDSSSNDENTSGSLDEHITIKKRRRKRIISSDTSSNDENITTNNTKYNIKNNYRLQNYKIINQEKSQSTDVTVVRDMRVKLIRLEEMNNIYFRKWQERNAPQIITTRYQLSYPNKISLYNKEESNIRKKFKTVTPISNLQLSKYQAVDKVNMTKLTTKYKLFKTFKVLMIKLEALGYSSKNGIYSSTEIDHLTKKYIHRIKHTFKYRLTHLQKEKTAITDTKENNKKSGNVFHISSDNNMATSETLITQENAIEVFADSQTENVKSGNNPSKTYCKSASIISHKTLTTELTASSINGRDLQMKPLEICPKTLTEKEIFTETSASIQSPPTAQLSQLVPREAKVDSENINSQLALSFLSKKDNMSTLSEEFTSPKITLSQTSIAETSLKSITTCNEISIPQLSNNTISPNNLNIKEVVCKNDLSQSKENLVTKNVYASKKKDITTTSNSPLLNMLSKNTLMKLASKASEISPDRIDRNLQTVNSRKKAKSKMCNNRHPLLKKRKGLYKCRICTRSFLDYQLFYKHLVNDLCGTNNVDHPVSNASKSLQSSKLEQTIINEKYNLQSPKLSISQQPSSIDKDSDMHITIQSSINSDDKISSSSSLVSDKKPKCKIKSIEKCKFVNLNLENKTRNHKAKQKEAKSAQQICNICSRIFDSYEQLSEHIFKHTSRDLQNAYVSIKNKTLPACPPKINNINDQMLNCTNKNQINVGKTIETSNDCTKERRLENIISSNVLENGLDETQYDTSKNKSLTKLQQNKDIINKNWNEIFLIGNIKNKTKETLSMEKGMENNIEKHSETFSESQLVKSVTICECHKNEVIEDVGIQIEIILFCNICQTLFRRIECFETHYRFSQGSCCERNQREDRIPQFFCSYCLKMLNSPKDMLHHLEWHAESNPDNTVSFRCNICKVIFYGLDLLFKAHFYNHVKNSFFLASRFSFSKSFDIGSKVIKAPIGKKSEVFIQIADYVCQRCKMPFLSEKNMKFHEKHCYNNVKNIDSLNNTIQLNFKNIPILLVCGFCNTNFSDLTAFELHSFMHKQKRNVETHYTCVTLSDMKKVYICNVCGISCQTVLKFKEHLSTHGELKEDYICSECNKHFTSIYFFFEHVGTHKKNGNMLIKCKVVYHDPEYIYKKSGSRKSDYEYNTKRRIIGIDIPYMTLRYFGKKESPESTIGVKSSTSITIESNPSTKIDEIIMASSIDDEVQIIDTDKYTNDSQIPKLSSENVIITKSKHPVKGNNAIENEPKINDNRTTMNGTDNLNDSNNKSMILENEENLILNRTTKQTDDVLSHIDIHDIFNLYIANKEVSFKNTIGEIFNNISKNLSTNIKSNVTTKEYMTSNTSDNVSTSNTMTETNNRTITNSTDNLDDSNNELMILENEENLILNRTTKQINHVLSHTHSRDILNLQITDKQASFENVTPIVTIGEIFNDISKNLSTNIKSNVTTKESMTSSTSDNVSTSNTMTETNNRTTTSSTDNLDDLNNKLMILENEENLILNRTTKQINDVLSYTHSRDILNLQITDKQVSFENVTPIITIDEIFNDINKNLSTNIKSNLTTKESMTSSTSDNVSTSNTMTETNNENIEDLTITQDDNRIEIQPLTSSTNSQNPKDLLSGNAAKSAPKSFLRVKSLTELMSPSKKDSVHCDSSFDTSQKWEKYLHLRNRPFIENKKTPLTNNSYASKTSETVESEFRLPMHSSTMTSRPIDLSNHTFRTVLDDTENYLDKVTRPPPPPYYASHTNLYQMRRYSVVINNTANDIVNTQNKDKWIPQQASYMMNTQLPPKSIYYQNSPNHIYNPTSKPTQSNQQYYDNIQPHMHTSYQSSRPPQLIAQTNVNSNNLLYNNNNTILPAQNSIPSVNQNNMHAGNTMPITHTVPPSAQRIQKNFICHSCPNIVFKSWEELIAHLIITNHNA